MKMQGPAPLLRHAIKMLAQSPEFELFWPFVCIYLL